MRIQVRNELVLLNLLVLVLIVAIIFFPTSALRTVLGLPFLLFSPGYALMAALFPLRDDIDAVERLALSFSTSIVIVASTGLILSYTPWGFRLESVLCSVLSFITITSIVACIRRNRFPQQERFTIEFQLRRPRWASDKLSKVLSIIVVVAILATLAVLAYVVSTPKVGEKFTEFYILDSSGKAIDYPKVTIVNQESEVIVGIINYEDRATNYSIEVEINGVRNNEAGPIILANGQKWEETMGFTPRSVGAKQKTEFLLFRDNEARPSLRLHLWIDVTE